MTINGIEYTANHLRPHRGSVTSDFRKLDMDVGEIANAIDGDGSAKAGI